jgi:DNA-binding NarL/FixJ family response regulator
MIRVAIVEDDVRLRKTLAEVIGGAKDCQFVGAFSTGAAAVAKLPALAPDVIIMDINLPDFTGVECVSQIAPHIPDTQIIMLTAYQNPELISQALIAGAHGYLVKPVMPQKLLEAIREIRAGGVPMSRTIARQVLEFLRRPTSVASGETPLDSTGLGQREQQVLNLLAAGFSYKEIASELNIKSPTVGTYVRRIYEKLHIHSRREIIARYKPSGPGSAPKS